MNLSLRQLTKNFFNLSDSFSLRKDILTVANVPSKSSLRLNLLLLHTIYRFAPEVRLHPDEDYMPSSVPWYLARVHMRKHRQIVADAEILDKGQVNVQTLISRTHDDDHSGQGWKTEFFLQIPNDDDEAATRRGELVTAECYVHFRPTPAGNDGYDIQYCFFYPYNGDITSVLDPAHEGDWEHITIRVTDADGFNRINKIFFARHGKEGVWRSSGFIFNQQGHLVIWSAKYSHASYTAPGEQARSGALPNDYTEDGGPIWNTWKNLKAIGERSKPTGGQLWIKYNGHWGEIGHPGSSGELGSSGPHGPAFQAWWDDDDKSLE